MNTYPCYDCGADINVPGQWVDHLSEEFECPECGTINFLAHDCYSDYDPDGECATYFEAPWRV